MLSGNPGNATALVVSGSPASGGSTRSRVLFQTLIAAAQKSVYITTPYFLPDRSMRDELVCAKKRGVTVRLVVPDKRSDHALTRSSGRRAYGDLLKAGADVYEYEPATIHAKITIVDGVWSVAALLTSITGHSGSTMRSIWPSWIPLSRSKLAKNFDGDISHSKHVTLDEWEKRSIFERMLERVGWVVERQQ